MTVTDPAPSTVDPAWPTERTLLADRDDFVLWGRRAMLVSVAIACLIVMAEIDRVLASIVSADGHTVTLSALTGPLSFANQDGWAIWTDQPVSAGIIAYALVDLVFIVAYGSVLWRLARPAALWFWPKGHTGAEEAIKKVETDAPLGADADVPTVVVRRWVRYALRFALLADVLESVLLIAIAIAIAAGGPGPSLALAYVLAGVSLVKWVALALTVALIVGVKVNRQALGVMIRRLAAAAKVHRLALVFLLLFASVALIPSGAIVFDQMPDVQRRWFTMPTDEAGHILAATVGIPLVAAAFWMLGRRRSERTVTVLRSRTLPTATPDYRWFIAPALMLLFAVPVLAWTSAYPPIFRLGLLLLTPVGLAVAISWRVQKKLESSGSQGDAVACTDAVWEKKSKEAARFEFWVMIASVIVAAVIIGVLVVLDVAGTSLVLVNFGVVAGIVISATAFVGLSMLVRRVWRRLEGERRARKDTGGAAENQRAEVLSRQVWDETNPNPPETEEDADSADDAYPDAEAPARTSPGDELLEPGRGPFLVPPLPKDPAEFEPRGILTTRTGDLIAVLVLCLSALGIIRSAVGPVFVSSLITDRDASGELAQAWSWLIVAAVCAVILPWVATWMIHRIDGGFASQVQQRPTCSRELFDPTVPTDAANRVVSAFEVALVVLGAAPLALAATWPEQFADALGPIGATVALLGGWSLVLGTAIVALQRRKPLAVFRALGLRSTPVITIVLIVMLATSTFANTPELHAVRTLTDTQVTDAGANPHAGADNRANEDWASAAFNRWLTRDHSACAEGVRPLLLIVAEGGGARAAYWTTSVLAELEKDPCLADSALVASGISGGSVGLAIDQVYPASGATEEEPAAAVQAVADITGPNPLARAITGLLAGDLLAGATGLRFPTAIGIDADGNPQTAWVDRAGHLERGWENETAVADAETWRSPLEDPMTIAMPKSGPLLILNSIDAVSGCRVLVAQNPFGQRLTPKTGSDGESGGTRLTQAACTLPSEPAAGAIALEHLYAGCTVHLRRSSAAMLSARFPIVTPGGRLPFATCGPATQPEVQLVDGGYGDPSGLSTMAEIAPAIVSEVAQYNLSQEDVVVVPVVVYLKNSLGAGIAETDLKLSPELFVPIAGYGARGLQTAEATWLQRLNGVVAEACGGEPAGPCAATLDDLRTTQVVLVAPQTTPAVAPPLGWTLSEMSRSAMDFALKTEAAATTEEGPAACDWARLGDLTAAFTNSTARAECE